MYLDNPEDFAKKILEDLVCLDMGNSALLVVEDKQSEPELIQQNIEVPEMLETNWIILELSKLYLWI